MEDDPELQNLIQEMLGMLNYSVILASNGEETMEIIKSNNTMLNVVGMIMDLTVRYGTGGKQAVTEVRKINPQMPVFVISGYSHHPAIEHPEEYGFTASLSKPFQIESLIAMLQKHLPEKIPMT